VLTCDCLTRPPFMMTTLLNGLIMNEAYHDYLAVLKGARNGFVYGVKVRFPHALVMSILFGHGRFVLFTFVEPHKLISSVTGSQTSPKLIMFSFQLERPCQNYFQGDQAACFQPCQICSIIQSLPIDPEESK